jgi:hypothetical protein
VEKTGKQPMREESCTQFKELERFSVQKLKLWRKDLAMLNDFLHKELCVILKYLKKKKTRQIRARR